MRFSKRFATISLAITMAATGIFLSVGPGSDTVEARGRSVTVTRNDIVAPGITTASGIGPCLQSLAEWEPVGSKVEVEFVLQARLGNASSWKIVDRSTQSLPGKAQSATVDWPDAAPGFQYRHLFQLYSVKGKDGSSRNQQLASDFTETFLELPAC